MEGLHKRSLLLEDLEIEILCRLTIGSLSRCKRVCKSWNTLIKSPTFARLQIDRSKLQLKSDDYDLLVCSTLKHENRIYLLSGKSMESLGDIQMPNIKGQVANVLIGTCNGIICLSSYLETYALFNPITKDFKVIPTPPEINPPCKIDDPGLSPSFGFDVKGNDYKLLRFIGFDYDHLRNESSCILHIYSSNHGSWKEITHQGLPGRPQYPELTGYPAPFGKHWEGVYFFVTCYADDGPDDEPDDEADDEPDDEEISIISFDLHTETFEIMSAPFDAWNEEGFDKLITIEVLNEDIALIISANDCRFRNGNLIDVWVMREYGNKESWVRIFSMGGLSMASFPLGFWKDDAILFQINDIDPDPDNIMIGELVSCERREYNYKNL